jgi:hypothetical protein
MWWIAAEQRIKRTTMHQIFFDFVLPVALEERRRKRH